MATLKNHSDFLAANLASRGDDSACTGEIEISIGEDTCSDIEIDPEGLYEVDENANYLGIALN